PFAKVLSVRRVILKAAFRWRIVAHRVSSERCRQGHFRACIITCQNSPMGIQIFVTGGTFDKEYNELTGELFFKETHLTDMLRLGRCHLDVEIESLLMIDSLEMTDAHRALILERCTHSSHSRIVITHGTDTMDQTAAVLGKALTDKTVVLTGAMVPYTFGSSDGMFNLGTALAFV